MADVIFQVFTPVAYVAGTKVLKLLEDGKIIEEQKDFVRIQKTNGDIATVDPYGRVTWE